MSTNNRMALVLLVILAAAVGGCTKESPFQEEPKIEVSEKSLIDTESVYLHVPSQGDSTRTASAGRPHWMGSEQLVKFKWTPTSLKVLQLEPEDRFQGNPTNEKVVFEIPVEHLDYNCASDRFGECTNKEEQNNKVDWSKKTKFRPDFAHINISQVQILPVELENYFGGGCYRETSSHFAGYTFEADAVNFKIERSYTASIECLDDSAESLADATFTTMTHYSFIKLDKIKDPSYQKVVYPQKDENDFGLFTTEVKSLDVDNRDVVNGKITYLNRWNPDKGTIVYHMSDSFNEFPKLKEASQKAVAAINTALAKANLSKPLKLELREPSGKEPGDLRNNMLVLVKDPLAARVIGYGPSAANPLTGEIVNARTVMYLGTILTTIRTTYNDFVQSMKEKPAPLSSERTFTFNIPGLSQTAKPELPAALLSPLRGQENLAVKLPRALKNSGGIKVTPDLAKLARDVHDYTRNVADTSSLQDRLTAMSKHCFYPAELFNFEDVVKYGLGELKDLVEGPLKPWDELTDAQKKKVLDVMVPYVWIPTLVHELGHNLGLRHNFQGSEDKANYYSLAELQAMGINHPIKFASVMDYPYSSLHELPTLGKTDIATLRFALSRKVEMTDGSLKSIPHTLADFKAKIPQGAPTVKDFGYCTDEHVDANPGCKRFDEGTTLGEITQHFASTFDKDFKRRNFRNNLRSYSLFSEGLYASRVEFTLRTIRLPFELYTRILNEFDIPPELWETDPFLKDLRLAVTTAAGVYAQILKTPDTTCAIAAKANPTQIIAAVPLAAIDPRAATCWEMTGLRPEFMVAGQAGRAFQSKKSSLSDNPYADQIDVRGIWVDKMLALNYLTKRKLGSSIFDKYTENYLHDEKTLPQTLSTLVSLLADDFLAPVTFETADGQAFTGRIRYSLNESHIIARPLDMSVVRATAIGESTKNPRDREYEVPFLKEMVRTIRREVPSSVHQSQGAEVLELFQVFTSAQDLDPAAIKAQVKIGTVRYFALEENVAARMSIGAIGTIRDLSKLQPPELQAISAKLKADPNAQPPADASPEVKKAYTYKPDVIDAFVRGGLKDEAYHARLLNILATVQP